MSRYFLQIGLLSVILLTVVMVMIESMPVHDDPALRAILIPENCEMPCFMGIRPGVTTMDEAIAILEKHEWATNVHTSQGAVVWDWSGKQPDFIRTDITPALLFGPFNTVDMFWLYTNKPLGDMLVMLPNGVSSGFSFLDRPNAISWNVNTIQDKLSFVIAITCDQWNVFYGRGAIVFTASISKPSYSMNWGDLNSRQERYCQ